MDPSRFRETNHLGMDVFLPRKQVLLLLTLLIFQRCSNPISCGETHKESLENLWLHPKGRCLHQSDKTSTVGTADSSWQIKTSKKWIYQHGILPRVLWLPLVFEFPLSTADIFESRISCNLCRCLGLLSSLCSIALFGNRNKTKFPFNSWGATIQKVQRPESLPGYSGLTTETK